MKVENAEIEGKLIFRFLPHFAQMKAVNAMRKPVHTEKGIFDAMPLLPWLPKPSVAVILSEVIIVEMRISTTTAHFCNYVLSFILIPVLFFSQLTEAFFLCYF